VNRFACSANIPCVRPSLAYAENFWFIDSGYARPVRGPAVFFRASSFASALWFFFASSSTGKRGACGAARKQQARPGHEVLQQALQREVQYRVVLPKDYFTTENRYPVLYLLHGLTGHYRSFEAHSNLTRYLERYQLIAVSIEGENSWYVNSATNPKEKWEDYFLQDVLSDVGERFRINGGDARAIAGISSGGYAAINLALKYPGLFFFAGSLSGAVTAPRNPEFDKAFKSFGFTDIFGPPDSKTRKENDVFLLAEKAEPQHTTFIFMACGTDDDTIIGNHQFADLLRKRHIAYEMTEFPGEHEWSFWEAALPQMLRSLARRMPDVVGVDLR
jgi:S-formylglutathione hydrolase FrmB